MSLTDGVILIFILLMLAYALYDEFGMNLLKGKTLLKVQLKRGNRLDCLIFVGLIAILNLSQSGRAGSADNHLPANFPGLDCDIYILYPLAQDVV